MRPNERNIAAMVQLVWRMGLKMKEKKKGYVCYVQMYGVSPERSRNEKEAAILCFAHYPHSVKCAEVGR
jgi:hypothetical protein